MSFLKRGIVLFGVTLGVTLAVPAPGATPAWAQSPPADAARVLRGRVIRAGAPVAGARVTLHRVTSQQSGPLGEQTTGTSGSFRFPLPAVDTAGFNVFFVTVDFETVRYFGAPVHQAIPDDYAVEVFDTTSALPGAVRTTRRDVVLMPQTDGSWEVNEIVRLRNTAGKAIVPAGGMPTWDLQIPEEALDFQAGEGDGAQEQVRLVGDRVALVASLVPGDRDLFFRYRLPANVSRTALPVHRATDTLNVYVRQPAPEVRVSGMKTTRSMEVEGERYVQYGATDLAPGSSVEVQWSGHGGPPVSPVVAGVAAALALLALGSWVAFRNRDGRGPLPAAARPADRVA